MKQVQLYREKVIREFDDAKELVWLDDDEYTVGYNNGLEAGKNIVLSLLKEQNGLMLALEQSNAMNECLNAEVERLNGLLKEQGAETELCDRCGRVRLKSKWDRR